MRKVFLVFTSFLLIGPLLKTNAQTYTLSGIYKSSSSTNCYCSNLGSITFDYNDKRASYPFCLDNVNGSLSDGQSIVVRGNRVSGQCDNGDMFVPTQFYNTTELVTGVFKKGNFQCPLQNEGKIHLQDGTTIDVSSSVQLTDGQKVTATNASWGLKFCNGQMFSVYFIKSISGFSSAPAANASSGGNNGAITNTSGTRTTKSMTGYFDSKKGIRHHLSLIGYNIGNFSEMQKGGGQHVVCFDRLAGGKDLDINSNPIVIEGYFEMTKKPAADPYMQTTVNDFSENVFYVTKWRYY